MTWAPSIQMGGYGYEIHHLIDDPVCAGPFMYKATWFLQYFNLSIANIGNVILAGESLKVRLLVASSWLLWSGMSFSYEVLGYKYLP